MVSVESDTSWRARLFDESLADDVVGLNELRGQQETTTLDFRSRLREELSGIRGLPRRELMNEPSRWVYYPWRRTLVGILGPESFSILRLDRNRNKITRDEQLRLRGMTIGVVGLSVGHAIAHALVIEGLCGAIRLADFDTMALSNLNRVPAGILDLGVNKAVVAARRIAELDPYLTVSVFPDGLSDTNSAAFFDGLDLVIEECDSLDVKFSVRRYAREQRIPVLMGTTDRGLLDVERFDLEPDRPLFHGRLGEVDVSLLAELPIKEKIPYALRLLSAPELSPRMAASLVEVGSTLSTWPQLGSEVVSGAASVAAAVRRIGLGHALPSGRIRVDPDEQLNRLNWEPPERGGPASGIDEGVTRVTPGDGIDAVVEAVRWAPSGGNAQPWFVRVRDDGIHIHADFSRTSLMDMEFRGTYVAIGAAVYNAKVAAAAYGILGEIELFPDDDRGDHVATMSFGNVSDPVLVQRYPAVMDRVTNRRLGAPAPIEPAIKNTLEEAARAEGGRLHLFTEAEDIADIAEIVAAADRIRYLTAALHEQMIGELRWPGHGRPDTGIDVAALGLDAGELASLDVVIRSEVMETLALWGAGRALGNSSRERLLSSSAVGVLTVRGHRAIDFVRGGSAAEAVWVRAHEYGLGVQPMSPVFLYARDLEECSRLSGAHAIELAALRTRMRELLELAADDSLVLVLRISHDSPVRCCSNRMSSNSIRH